MPKYWVIGLITVCLVLFFEKKKTLLFYDYQLLINYMYRAN